MDVPPPLPQPAPSEPPPWLHLATGVQRCPHALLEQTWQDWTVRGEDDLWIFGYASLIWNPEIDHDLMLPARVHGYHRALRMWSRINRGTPERPGLVFALLPGGACRGVVMRVSKAAARQELTRLWAREMPVAVYDPRWLRCRTPNGTVRALGFTLHPGSPSHTGPLPDDVMVRILRESRGRYGTTLDYMLRTHDSLRSCGISDRSLMRLVRLARQHGLDAGNTRSDSPQSGAG